MKVFIGLPSIIFLFFFTANGFAVRAQETIDLNGIWMARGYGRVLEFDALSVRIYDLTGISCTANEEYPLSMFSDVSIVSDSTLIFNRGVTQYIFDKITKLPNLCNQKLSKKQRTSAHYNFDVLWITFNEHYAYFKERDINWQEIRDKYKGSITDTTSEVELFTICYNMLEELNDGHVDIEASNKIMRKAGIFALSDERPNPDFKGTREAILSKYVNEPKRHNISRTVWGKINDSTGYVQINSMGAQAYFGIVDNTIPENGQKRYLKYLARTPDTFLDEVNGMDTTMKKVIDDLKGTSRIILDIRFNGGGEDLVGLTALSHLINTEKTVFTKKNRVGETFSEAYPFKLIPKEKTYAGKLYLLQSHYSASATEVLLLASLGYDKITRLGSSSEGIFSDILDKKLPNGWEFGLSNEVYQDMNCVSYEVKGIPVHVDFDYPEDTYEFVNKLKKDLERTGDSAIEYVLSQ